ncbi:MAG: hypothetical protein JNL25_12010 [Rhodospirillaceae bacterium]|nr:hypothetical protein [Rhodospirillaceae bacterium]
MRRFLLAAWFAIALSGPAHATDYLSGISDLPLPEGLVEAKEDSTVFDTLIGRIVTAYAKGPGTADSVHDFYEATLPQLGWTETDEGNWRRENQTLKIDVLGPDAGPVTATFTLSSDN